MRNGPIEPSADARTFARGVYEQYVALTLEGFTEAQALQIMGVVLSSIITPPTA